MKDRIPEISMKAKQRFRGDKERSEAAWRDSLAEKSEGPAEVMKEVTAEAIRRIEEIFDREQDKKPEQPE